MHPALALFAPDRAIERREGQTSSHIYRPGDGDPTHRIMVTKSDLLTSSPRTAKRSSQKSEQFSSRPIVHGFLRGGTLPDLSTRIPLGEDVKRVKRRGRHALLRR